MSIYLSPEWLSDLSTCDPSEIEFRIDYKLWDSSTDFMCTFGVPTDVHVQRWLECLRARPDVEDPIVMRIILNCEQFIT